MSFDIKNYISNLTYINKDFNSTWEEILEVVPQLTTKWNPNESNESDPLVVLLKELGIVTDKLNYNIDKNTLEAFPDLLTQIRAAYSVFGSMGYIPQWYRSALTNITILYNGGASDISASDIKASEQQQWTFPKFTSVSNEDNTIQYVTLGKLEFKTGVPSGQQVLAIEGTLNDLEVNGSTKITLDNLDSQRRLYFLQPNVAQNGIFISNDESFESVTIEDSTYDQDSTDYVYQARWRRVTNLYQQLPGQYVFKFGIDPTTGSTYIQFPEDIGDLIGDGVYIKYILSSGESGNIKASTLTSFPTSLSIEPDYISSESTTAITSDANLSAFNSASTQNGKDPETIEEMQQNYSKVVGTFNTLVTTYDYENYIYNQTDAVGRPYVSNIKVSDMNTDLYTAYKVKTLGAKGEFSTIKSNEAEREDDTLTPYDLRFYPVGTGQSVTDLDSFRGTFKVVASKKMELENVVGDAKTILHEYKPLGTPLFLDYSLKGQIYLQKTVSKEEAKEIKANVDLALYNKLEARNLTFGQEINYGEVVDVIKAADPRIQYVALEPISYNLAEDSKSEYDNNSKYDIYTKSVLAGITPWTTFEPMRYYWGTEKITTYGQAKSSSTSTQIATIATYAESTSARITSLSPQVTKVSLKDNQYEVKANETFYILAPGYTTTTSYGNYFYMKSTIEVVKDTPIKLGENQYIYIYEERPSTDSVKPAYTIGKDAIIRCNIDISDPNKDKDAKYQIGKAINMGSNITLEILGPDEYKLKNTYPSTADKGIKIATNAVSLVERLKNSNSSYTLNVGEYLLWTNILEDESTPITEVGIVGEGNTLSWKDPLAANNSSFQAISASMSNYSEYSWISVKNEALTYRTNTLYSFGEGTTLKFSSSSPWNEYSTTQIFDLNSSLAVEYASKGETSWQTIPSILADDHYQAFVGLSLLLSPNKVQKLEENQQVEITFSDKSPSTIQPTTKGTYIQSNSTLVYAGGQPLVLSDYESDLLVINALEGEKLSLADVDAFIPVGENGYELPDNRLILYALKDSKDVISYYIGNGNSISSSSGQVGFAYEIPAGAKYWNGAQLVKVPNEFTNLSTDLTYLYNANYSPVYQPSESDLIENPLDPASFFKSSHVCNKFVLPRLRKTEKKNQTDSYEVDPLVDLVISPLSIRS